MDIKKLFSSKSLGDYMGLGVLVFAIISLITYLMYSTSLEGLFVPIVLILLIIIILGEIAQFFFSNYFIPIIVSGCTMAAFGCFLANPAETLGSIVDYIQNIVMFGNPDKFGIIVVNIIFMLIMSILAIVACFMYKGKEV